MFFSETVLITNTPIDIINNQKIVLKKPLNAITSGAHIKIEITNMFKKELEKVFSLEHLKNMKLKIEKTINPKNIKILLYTKENKKINLLLEKGYLEINKNSISILFTNSEAILEKKFYTIEINTSILLKKVNISWINFKK